MDRELLLYIIVATSPYIDTKINPTGFRNPMIELLTYLIYSTKKYHWR